MDHSTAVYPTHYREHAQRWLCCNVVGIMGFALQTATLWTLVHWSGLPASVSVAIAVLVAVSHNFVWHERYTWPGRPRHERARRWLSFNMANGLISLITNVGLTLFVIRLTGL